MAGGDSFEKRIGAGLQGDGDGHVKSIVKYRENIGDSFLNLDEARAMAEGRYVDRFWEMSENARMRELERRIENKEYLSGFDDFGEVYQSGRWLGFDPKDESKELFLDLQSMGEFSSSSLTRPYFIPTPSDDYVILEHERFRRTFTYSKERFNEYRDAMVGKLVTKFCYKEGIDPASLDVVVVNDSYFNDKNTPILSKPKPESLSLNFYVYCKVRDDSSSVSRRNGVRGTDDLI